MTGSSQNVGCGSFGHYKDFDLYLHIRWVAMEGFWAEEWAGLPYVLAGSLAATGSTDCRRARAGSEQPGSRWQVTVGRARPCQRGWWEVVELLTRWSCGLQDLVVEQKWVQNGGRSERCQSNWEWGWIIILSYSVHSGQHITCPHDCLCENAFISFFTVLWGKLSDLHRCEVIRECNSIINSLLYFLCLLFIY